CRTLRCSVARRRKCRATEANSARVSLSVSLRRVTSTQTARQTEAQDRRSWRIALLQQATSHLGPDVSPLRRFPFIRAGLAGTALDGQSGRAEWLGPGLCIIIRARA